MPPPPEVADSPLCEHCGYNLTGLPYRRCPECGRAFLSSAFRASRIPWTRRRAIGGIRAYAMTMWAVVRRPRDFVRDASDGSAHTFLDADAFRRVTVMIAALALAAVTTATVVVSVGRIPAVIVAVLLAPAHLAVARGFFLRATESVGMLGVSIGRRLDLPGARPVLCYACAPLALSPAVATVACLGLRSFESFFRFGQDPAITAAGVAAASLLVTWLALVIRLVALMTGDGARWLSRAVLVIVVDWVLAAMIWTMLMAVVTLGVLAAILPFLQ